MKSELIDKEEAATYLRVSVRTLDRLRVVGELKSIKIAGCVRFRVADLEEYLRQHTTGGRPMSA